MKHRILSGLANLVVRHYVLIAVLLLALGGLALKGALQLTINSNQIDLLDQDLRPIQELKRITQMTGGTGFLFLAIKGDDPKHLQDVADGLASRIEALPQVRSVTYKQEAPAFIRKNIAMFLKTNDLKEVRKRIKKKVRAEIRKQNPFGLELTKPKPVVLDFDDMVEKYRSMGKKGIESDYYLSTDIRKRPAEVSSRYRNRHMLLMLIKPQGESTDLDFTRDLIGRLDQLIAGFNESNDLEARVLEGYGEPAPEASVTYGYTGGYKLNLDDFQTIRDSLIPTSVIALAGILVVLIIFIRRLSFILILQVALTFGVLFTFGIASVTVGKLNVITTVMGCILQGLGIDYGIHLLYRLREEYILTRDLPGSISMAIVHSGSACAATAFTTAAAFFVMTLSEFKGFSDFGLLAGIGVMLIALTTYVVVPVLFLLVTRVMPSFPDLLLPKQSEQAAAEIEGLARKRFPRPGLVLLLAAGITCGLGAVAVASWGDVFDYNARSLMVPNQPSIILQQEINDRFQISSDPVGIYTENEEQYRLLYDTLHPPDLQRYASVEEVPEADRARYGDSFSVTPHDHERFGSIDAVMSLHTLLPPRDQQEENAEVLALMKRDVRKVDPDSLEPDEREAFERYLTYLEAKPFGFEELARGHGDQFMAVEAVRDKYPGWLTFIYPKVSLWDGRDLLEFDADVEVIRAEDGTEFYSTGMAILFAKLATIVLSDGQRLTAITFAVVFLMVLVNFQRLGATLIALLPLVVGILWMLGLMRLGGLRLNFINIVVLTLIFGYGIDTGIHLHHRFSETGSVMRAMRTTGGAVLASMLTAVVGWGALSFAEHRGLQSMGLLACIGIASALVVSLTVLPAVFQVVADRREATGRGAPGSEEAKS